MNHYAHLTHDDYLAHYGVKGMKWGVRKSVYKSMSISERKETRKKYYQTPEGKIKKATTIGTVLGGPLAGVIAGSITAKKVNTNQISNSKITKQKVNSVSKNTINKGKKAVDSVKDRKIETDEDKVKRLIQDGRINSNTHHIFDQNGNLMMVYWDD